MATTNDVRGTTTDGNINWASPTGDYPSTTTAAGGGGSINLLQLSCFILRAVAIPTTFIATIVMGVTRESSAGVTIKAMEFSQLEYFVAVNAIAFVYASFSLGLSILYRRPTSAAKNLILAVAIADVAMVAFLFSGNGSASGIRLLFGGDVVYYRDYCNLAGGFCSKLVAAIVFSMFGAVFFIALTVISLVALHRTSP